MNQRRAVALLAVLALCLLSFSSGAGANQPTAPVGTATTGLQLAEVALDGVPGLEQQVELGSLLGYASTDGDAARNARGGGQPFALSSVALPGGLGLAAQSHSGETVQEGHTAALPADAGTVTAGELRAAVTDGTARSLITALAGSLDAGLAGLAVSTPEQGAATVVDAVSSTATNGAVLSGLSLGLTDVLPADLLARLPLEVLLGLVDQLPVALPADLDVEAALAEVQAAVAELQAALDAAVRDLPAQIADARTVIEELRGQLDDTLSTDVAELEAQIAVLDETIATLQAEIATLTALLDSATCDGVTLLDPLLGPICDEIAALEQELAEAQEERQALVAQLELVNEIAAAEQTLDALIDQLITAIEGVLDSPLSGDITLLLEGLVADLLEGLQGLELLGVGRTEVGVHTVATGDDATAGVLCAVSGVSVLGQGYDADTCDELRGALTEVRTTLLGVLADLPIAGDLAADVVSVGGLETTTEETADGGYRAARAAVTPLHLGVQPIALTTVTDGLVDGLLGDLVGQLEALLGTVGDVTGVAAASPVAAAALPDDLTALIGELESLLVADLDGAVTPALSLTGLGISSVSEFSPAGLAPVPVDTPTTPTTPTSPGTPGTPTAPGTPGAAPVTGTPDTVQPVAGPPAQPTPSGSLPRTGGYGLVGLALALLSIGAGGTMTLWSHRVGR